MLTTGCGRIQSLLMRKQELREDKDLASGIEEDACKTGDTRLSLLPAPRLSQQHPASGDITWSFMFQQWGQAEFPGLVKVTASRKIKCCVRERSQPWQRSKFLAAPSVMELKLREDSRLCAVRASLRVVSSHLWNTAW